MILVFQDDGSMRVIESVTDANHEYEAIDVENREYTFLDDRGCELTPVLREPAQKKWLFFFWIAETVPFTFTPTNQRREDLLAGLRSGEILIDSRSSSVRTLDDLHRIAPHLFAP